MSYTVFVVKLRRLYTTYKNIQKFSSRLTSGDEFIAAKQLSAKTGRELLLASTSSNGLLGQGSEKVFNECPGVSNVFPSA